VERPEGVGWIGLHKRELIVLTVVLLGFAVIRFLPSVLNSLLYPGPQDYEITWDLTVWIEAEEEEFSLWFRFYPTETDALNEQNKYLGVGIRIQQPHDPEHTVGLLVIPEDSVMVWARIWCTDHEDIVVLRQIFMAQKASTMVENRSLEYLIMLL
jgi:hypothetical protein